VRIIILIVLVIVVVTRDLTHHVEAIVPKLTTHMSRGKLEWETMHWYDMISYSFHDDHDEDEDEDEDEDPHICKRPMHPSHHHPHYYHHPRRARRLKRHA
jgi:hypothetical protein